MAEMVFQVFPGRVNVNDDITPIKSGDLSWNDDLNGFVTDANGRLKLNIPAGIYTFVGFSRDRHLLLVQEASVPGSVILKVSDAVPVTISCRAADGMPIPGAEIFFRPTKQARASVGYTNNSGLLNAYVSSGIYHAVLWAVAGKGPHYLILPNQEILPPKGQVNFHVAEIPSCEVNFVLPKGTAIAIFEVLESTYTMERVEGTEPEIGYDAAYTGFYPIISPDHPYTISANVDYNFNMSFAIIFGAGTIYAYELRPDIHSINPGVQRIGITENATFAIRVRAEPKEREPIYFPGERVALVYQVMDAAGNRLNRILNFSGARLILPMVTVWNPHGVPIANNFDTESFVDFSFDLPRSAALGNYKAEVFLDAGMYGRITSDFYFQVRSDSDSEPPQIAQPDLPAEFEAGQNLVIATFISDNMGIVGAPILRISPDAGYSWTEFPMVLDSDNLFKAVVPGGNLAPGELRCQIIAQDQAGNRAEVNSVINIVDTSPPVVKHEPLKIAELGRDLRIYAEITDNVGVKEADIIYFAQAFSKLEASGAQNILPLSQNGRIYSASVSGSEITFSGLSYYIRAADASGNIALFPTEIDTPKFIDITVKDTTPPAISHAPISIGITNTPMRIEAIITDNSGITEASLFYKGTGDQSYRITKMQDLGGIYIAEIPASAATTGDIHYHIEASDGKDPDGNIRTSSDPADGGDYLVEISAGPYGVIKSLEITPSASRDSPFIISAGESIRFKAIGRGESGQLLPVDVSWLAIGGAGHITQDGTFLATGRIPGGGIGRILATARQSGDHKALLQAETYVRISPGKPAYIILNTASIKIPAGTSYRFFAAVTDIYSNSVENPPQISWRMDTEGDPIGTVEDGIFRSSKAGESRILATLSNLQAVSDITVIPGPLKRIEVSPASGEVPAGDMIQFTAEGYDAFGNQISIAPIWSVRGGVGTIQGNGLFRGGTAGSGKIAATVGDVSAAVDVRVVPGQLSYITISPYVSYLPISTAETPSTQQFAADGWDIAGNPVPLKSVSWSTDELAGTISSSGLFTAVTNPGSRLGEIVTNGSIWATGVSATGANTAKKSTVVIQKSPAGRPLSIKAVVQGTSDETSRVSLAAGETLKLEAFGIDVKERRILIYPSWSVEGGIGDIDPGGLFTARTPGSGAVIAAAGGFTSAIKVDVTPGPLKSIIIRPDILLLNPGRQDMLNAIGYDSFENVVPLQNVRWSVDGDIITIEPKDTSCLVRAHQYPGRMKSRNSVISISSGGIAGFANIFISLEAQSTVSQWDIANNLQDIPYCLEVEPDLVDLVFDSQQQFTALAVDILGNKREPMKLSWSATGGIGTIDSSGIFKTGNSPGSGRVIVTDGQAFAIAVINVSASVARGQELLIIPSQVSLTAGIKQKLAAFAVADSELIPVLPAWKVVGGIGTIDHAGRFTATNIGNGDVEAAIGGLTARCRISVSAGNPAQIEIQPSSASIKAGKQQKFSVICRDKLGNLITISPEFRLEGDLGIIDSNGFFIARKAGAGSLLASYNLLLTGKADIEVLPGDLAKIEVTPADQEVAAGNSIRLFAIGKDAYDNLIPVNPVWEIIGPADVGNISPNGLFTANRVGNAQVRSKVGEIADFASIKVHPAAPAFILLEPSLLSISSQSDKANQFKLKFLDQRGNVIEKVENVDLSWSVTPGIGSIDSSGLFINEKNLSETRTGYITATAIINRGSGMERTIRGRTAVILQPVAKPPAVITIIPDPAVVIKGDTQKFTAVGKDAGGIEVAVEPLWSVVSSDGSLVQNVISSDGIFKASPEMGVGSSWRVLASVRIDNTQSIQGSASLNLIAGPLQSIQVICKENACASPVESGRIVELEAVGYDRFSNQVQISPAWSTTGGIGEVTPLARSKASMAAGRAGSGEVIAAAEGKEGKAHITVKPGQLAGIIISTDPPPVDEKLGITLGNPLILKAGLDKHFTASGYDSDVDTLGNPKPVNTVQISPEWSLQPSDSAVDLGSISSDGRFTGKEAGTGRIEAKVAAVSASYHIRVTPGDLRTIRVLPSSISVVAGEEQQFSASGYDLYGNQIADLQPITWRVIGSIGGINENGSFKSSPLPGNNPVSGTIVASTGNIQGSASVTIVPALGKLSSISLTVEPAIIPAGGKAICILTGTDEMGNPTAVLPVSIELSVPAQLGALSPSDKLNEWTFRAEKSLSPDPNQRSGMLIVTAKTDEKTFSDSKVITLAPGPLSKIIVEPTDASVSAGNEQRFKAYGYDSWGNQTELISPEWIVSNFLGRLETDYLHEAVFTANTAGQGQIIVSAQGYEGRANLTVLPGEPKSLAIEPKTVTITAGSPYRFTGIGMDFYGNKIENLKLQWQVTGEISMESSVTDDGTLTSTKSGNGILKAFYPADPSVNSDEASVTVVPGPAVSASIFINKDSESLKPPFSLLSGAQYSVYLRGLDQWGNQTADLEKVIWSISGNTGSIISLPKASAALTALFPGQGQITASAEGLSAHADLYIAPHSYYIKTRKGDKLHGPFEASLNIPPGALRTDEQISIALSPSPGPVLGAKRIGHVYSFEPEGRIFQVPAELILSYSSENTSEIDDERLCIYSWDRFQKKWIRVGGIVDQQRKSVSATVNYLSLFAIMQEETDVDNRPENDKLNIAEVRLSPNVYFAPETNRLTIHYNIVYSAGQSVDVTVKIYDIRGHLVKQLLDKTSKYPGWNTDQWDGTDEAGNMVKNGRYFVLITAEIDSSKVSVTKHLAVFK